MQAETVHQDRQHGGQDKAPRRGHVGVGHVFVPGHHVVQIHHVALGHGQQAANQIDLGGSTPAPHGHASQRAKDRKADGGEQQNGKKGV